MSSGIAVATRTRTCTAVAVAASGPRNGDSDGASSEAEAEWAPSRTGRRRFTGRGSGGSGSSGSDSDGGGVVVANDMDDFVVDDDDASALEPASDDDEEGEEDDEDMDLMNRTESSLSSRRLRKRKLNNFFGVREEQANGGGDGDGDAEEDGHARGDGTQKGKQKRRGPRRREIAAVWDDDRDLEASTRRARDAEKARASATVEDGGDDEAVARTMTMATPDGHTTRVCLNPIMRKPTAISSDDDAAATAGTELEPVPVPPSGELGSPQQPVFAHGEVSTKLKPHQVIGARFLWSHVAVEPNGFGCILADFMGLGKTLQVITVVQAFLTLKVSRPEDHEDDEDKPSHDRTGSDDEDPRFAKSPFPPSPPRMQLVPRHHHVLILAPTICVRNWEAELVKWLGKKDARRLGVSTLESSREKKMSDRVQVIRHWYRRGGVLIMGYELYRILALQSSGDEKIAAGNAKYTTLIKGVYKYLCDPGPDLIVLDEGHRVRDHKSKLVKALSYVKTSRRIILTGYPLQNHLEEYWTMVNFARPEYLGSLDDFKNRFVVPIENGQCVDSTEKDRRLARQRAFVLTNELKTLVLRRDQEFLFRQLPPKKEWVLLCQLTDAQAQLYRCFLEAGVPKRGELLPGVGGKIDVLGGYHISLAIANHPDVLQETYQRLEEAMRSGKPMNGLQRTRRGPRSDGNLMEEEDLLQYLTANPGSTRDVAAARRRQSAGLDLSDDEESSLLNALAAAPGQARGSQSSNGNGNGKANGFDHRLGFARDFLRQYSSGQLESSGKMMILMELLTECKALGDRVILFSQSIPTLNTVETMIGRANRRSARHSQRISYLRIDGSTPQQERFRMISQFNDWEEDVDLILISTKAGGEGVNLCAGNRIIIFDVCWNPCNDSQSMCRSYRFGQLKPVFVYRFVSAGTMEKKVYDLQIRKEGVAKRIVDEKALERKFKNAELQDYFNLDEFEAAMKQQAAVLQRRTTAHMASTGLVTVPAASKDSLDMDTSVSIDLEDQAGKIADAMEVGMSEVVKPIPREDAVLESVLTRIQNRAVGADGPASGSGAACVLDWFEQETMFEETVDDECSAAEQEEITASYTYLKAVRKLRLGNDSWSSLSANPGGVSRDGVLVVPCGHCRITNEVYPEATTKVPVPKFIECRYCQRPTETTGAVPWTPATPAGAMALGGVPGMMSAGGMPMGGGAYGGAHPVRLPYPYPGRMLPGGVGVPMTPLDTGVTPNVSGVPPVVGPAGRVLPAHLYALYVQQQQQQASQVGTSNGALPSAAPARTGMAPAAPHQTHAELIRQQLEMQRQEMEKRRQERKYLTLADRHLLVLRRGMTRCQELKRQAEACGATLAIEVNSQLTDVVSAMSLEETLKWLKRTKLPGDVDFHDDQWLRNEIASFQSKPSPSQTTTCAPATSGTRGRWHSQTLSRATGDAIAAGSTTMTPAKTTVSTLTSAVSSSSASSSTVPTGETSHETISIDSSDSEDEGGPDQDARPPRGNGRVLSVDDVNGDADEEEDDDIIEIL